MNASTLPRLLGNAIAYLLLLTIVGVLAAGGAWLVVSAWRAVL